VIGHEATGPGSQVYTRAPGLRDLLHEDIPRAISMRALP